jgi:hypothetical protein
MTRLYIAVALTLGLLAAASDSLNADVRADQKTHVELAGMLGKMVNIFGGKAAREGVTSTVAVKGDRKATWNETTGQIVDLSEEKIYDLDIKRKTYKATTFAELRRRMEEAQKKAQDDARKEQSRQKSTSPSPDEKQREVDVDFSVRDTGQKKAVNGFDTHEVVMTITVREKGKTLDQSGGLVLTSDMWIAPKIAAMKEISDFDVRYAQKLYGTTMAGLSAEDMAAALALYPTMKEAVARMNAEGVKMDGTPVLTTLTFDAVKSAEQMAQEAKEPDDDTKLSPSGGVGGLMGGLAKKMAKKKTEGESKPRATFMTGTTEVLKVTTDISAQDVAVPSGFQQK